MGSIETPLLPSPNLIIIHNVIPNASEGSPKHLNLSSKERLELSTKLDGFIEGENIEYMMWKSSFDPLIIL